MMLTVRSDPSRLGGGWAVLAADDGALPSALAIEDRSSEMFLNEAGKWVRQATLLPVERIDDSSVRLGPGIVDAVGADALIAVQGPDGALLGTLVWPATVRPSAGASAGGALPDREAFALARRAAEAAHLQAGPQAAPPQAPAPRRVAQPPSAPDPAPASATAPPAASPSPPRRWPWLAAAAILILALGLFAALRDGRFARNLACGEGAPLRGVTLGGLLGTCPGVTDPEPAAWAAFRQCLASQFGCAAKPCAESYLAGMRPAAEVHGDEARRAARVADETCAADEAAKRTKADFAEFGRCLAAASPCSQVGCVDRWQAALTAEPYATSVRQARETAAAACARAQEEQAFSDFNRCAAGARACDKSRCASAVPVQWRHAAHGGEIDRILAGAERDCRAEEDRARAEQDFAAFETCLHGAAPCARAACVDRWQASLTDEPYATTLRQERDAAAAACAKSQEDDAYADFNRCVAGADACGRTRCAEAYPSRWRHGLHGPEVDRVESDAERGCQDETDRRRQEQDYAAFQNCLRDASPCAQGVCVDRWQSSLTGEPFASMLRRVRAEAYESCQRSQDDAAFSRCASENAACDRAACLAALPASARDGAHAREIDDLGRSAAEACAAARRPSPEQAALGFLEHYYRAHSSAGQASGESLGLLYGPTVTAYGKVRGREEFIAEKMRYFNKYSDRQFTIDPSSVNVSCDYAGNRCVVTGEQTASVYDTENARFVGGRSRFTFVFSDVTTSPRVVSEESKAVKQ